MKFSLLVLASPYSSQGSLSALKFAQSCLASGHEIYRVFFYHDGTHSASSLQSPPQDEINVQQSWLDLNQKHNLDLVVCIAAALKRGNLNQAEAERYERDHFNISEGFELSGLGQLLDAQINADRLVTFK